MKYLFLLFLVPLLGITQQIDSFTPTIASAGTQTLLTINGSDFGEYDPSYRIYIGSNIAVASYEIESWTDTTIVCRINSNARPGTIRINMNGSDIFSSGTITIRYGIYNAYNNELVDRVVPNLIPEYTFHVNGLSSNGLSRLQNAFDIWECATGWQFDYVIDTSVSGTDADGISCIYIAEGPGGCGTLPHWTQCNTTTYLGEVDIRCDDATPPLYYFIHELGHAIGLTHNYYDNQSVVQNAPNGPTYPSDIDIEAVNKIFELGNYATDCTVGMEYNDCYTLATGQFISEDETPLEIHYYNMLGQSVKTLEPNSLYICTRVYSNRVTSEVINSNSYPHNL